MFKQFKKQILEVSGVKSFDEVVRVLNLLQGAIAESLASLISKTQNDSTVLQGVQLLAGRTNVVSHTLGRKLAGWSLTRQRGAVASPVYDLQDANPSPHLTLWLVTPTNVTVDVLVF